MRIVLMLRCFDEKGGIGVYTRYLVNKLLEHDKQNTYLMFYPDKSNLGKFSGFPNVEEYHLNARNKFFWDQISVSYYAHKYKADVILNPKFSVPLFSAKKSIVVQHGADWFIPEFVKFYNRFDVIYNRIFVPLFCKKASFVITVSEITTSDFIEHVKVPPQKIKTVYFGPAEFFKRTQDTEVVRKKYNLPDRFIFTLSRFGAGGGMRKNIDKVFQAYKIYHENTSNPFFPRSYFS